MWKQNEKKESVLDDSQLSVASTHGQYFQLDMEDPEVTVWYCLSDKGNNGIYGVSPNDAANNYYIYSKDNIFYSGVGHSMVDSEMEAKLFINTIIGAYRVPYEPPIVEILNPEAEIIAHDQLVTPEDIEKMSGYVFLLVDSMKCRKELFEAIKKNEKIK